MKLDHTSRNNPTTPPLTGRQLSEYVPAVHSAGSGRIMGYPTPYEPYPNGDYYNQPYLPQTTDFSPAPPHTSSSYVGSVASYSSGYPSEYHSYQNDHGIDSMYAPEQTMEMEMFSMDANLQLKVQNLPVLENLANRIISTLATSTFQDILTIRGSPHTAQGQAYATLKGLFDQTRKLYARDQPFLDARALNLHQPEYRKVIRAANMATFFSGLLVNYDVGFSYLHEHFLEVLVAPNCPFTNWQRSLYVDLKTQAYISAMMNAEGDSLHLLNDLFPTSSSMPDVELQHHMFRRRQSLSSSSTNHEAISALSLRYDWTEFLKSAHECLRMNLSKLTGSGEDQPVYSDHDRMAVQRTLSQPEERSHGYPIPPSTPQTAISMYDQYHSMDGHSQSSSQSPPNSLTSAVNGIHSSMAPSTSPTAPTTMLYERARRATIARSSPNARRPTIPSQRRPWTSEEEHALMDGLDRVKGPHWSQILALYGPGGTISEILKDRNQVQLKDKARNLKLFFLKSGIDVPFYLQGVTGELKTRAPAQAAKQQAKKLMEQQRLQQEQAQAQTQAHSQVAPVGGNG